MDKFEVTIVYDKLTDGGEKKTSESYLFEADSHADAENKCLAKVGEYISGEYIVSDVKRKRIAEVFDDHKENFYNAHVAMITIDEKSGQEKRKNFTYLVSGDTLHDAYSRLTEHMKDSMTDYELIGINKSRILDYYTD